MKINTDYNKVGRAILLIVALVLVVQTIFAQKSSSKKDDEKIKMKIFIEKDGEKRLFEKEYLNEEEMNSDPALQSFKEEMGAGQDIQFDERSFMPPPPFPPPSLAFADSAFEKDMKNHFRKFNFKIADSLFSVPLPPLPPGLDSTLKAELFKMERLHPDSIFSITYFGDSLTGEGERPHVFVYRGKPGKHHEKDIKIFVKKKVKIEDLENKSSDLKLDVFNYYPNPNRGTFRVHFETKKDDPVTIKIYDEKGETIYMDKLEGPQGKYDKQIDISDKKKGTYILDIRQKGKGIKKKIIVE